MKILLELMVKMNLITRRSINALISLSLNSSFVFQELNNLSTKNVLMVMKMLLILMEKKMERKMKKKMKMSRTTTTMTTKLIIMIVRKTVIAFSLAWKKFVFEKKSDTRTFLEHKLCPYFFYGHPVMMCTASISLLTYFKNMHSALYMDLLH